MNARVLIVALCISPAFLLALPAAYAAKSSITGIYKVSGSGVCQSNDVGYGPLPELLALGSSSEVLDSWRGTVQFFPDGTATGTFHGQYALPSLINSQPLGDWTAVCQYATSSTNPDGSVNLVAQCSGTTLSGIGMNEQWTVGPIENRVVSKQGVLVFSRIGTQVETYSANAGTIVHYRICRSSTVGVK